MNATTSDVIFEHRRCRCSGLCSQDATRHLPQGPAKSSYLGYDLESYNDVVRVGVTSSECSGASKRPEFVGAKSPVDLSFLPSL